MDKSKNTVTSLYFIASIPPLEFQQKIDEIKQYFAQYYHSSHALKSPPHITLIPPFIWENDKENDLIALLEGFSYKEFPILINGFGAFKPRVIFAKVEENTDLIQLELKLYEYLKSHLIRYNELKPQKKFHPHMTVAFKDLKPSKFYDAWKDFEHKELEFSFLNEYIYLLKHSGRKWEIFKVFTL